MKKNSKIYIAIVGFSILTIVWGLVYIVLSLPVLELRQVFLEGSVYVREGKVRIEKINSSSPAASSGLNAGDIVVSVNGEKIGNSNEFVNIVYKNRGKTIVIVTYNKGTYRTVELIPRETYPKDEGPTGLVLSEYTLKRSNPIIDVPQILLQSYGGRDEPYFISLYPNRGFVQLLWLIEGSVMMVIAVGLLKFKKWALYSYIFLRGFFILYGTFFLITNGMLLSIKDNYRFYLGALLGITILVFFYSQRKLFK